jgi:hypothetical protein
MQQVIKIGTSSLINEKYGTLNLSSLSRICEVVRELHAKGTSGVPPNCCLAVSQLAGSSTHHNTSHQNYLPFLQATMSSLSAAVQLASAASGWGCQHGPPRLHRSRRWLPSVRST